MAMVISPLHLPPFVHGDTAHQYCWVMAGTLWPFVGCPLCWGHACKKKGISDGAKRGKKVMVSGRQKKNKRRAKRPRRRNCGEAREAVLPRLVMHHLNTLCLAHGESWALCSNEKHRKIPLSWCQQCANPVQHHGLVSLNLHCLLCMGALLFQHCQVIMSTPQPFVGCPPAGGMQ